MKNRYLFFKAETFDDPDLSDYTKEDTQIPKAGALTTARHPVV